MKVNSIDLIAELEKKVNSLIAKNKILDGSLYQANASLETANSSLAVATSLLETSKQSSLTLADYVLSTLNKKPRAKQDPVELALEQISKG